MSHRNDLNALTADAGDREDWQHAVTILHEAFQIVGIVLDDLEERVRGLEAAQGLERES
jgi:hypothetical protein